MSHANARFTPAGRLLIIQRVEAAMPAKKTNLPLPLTSVSACLS